MREVVVLTALLPAAARAQRPAAAASLVLDRVTVVDVEQGRLVPDQRVVVAGSRIQAMGSSGAVKSPAGAHVVDARGKYLIPGLWDMHHHTVTYAAHLLLLANGVTGFRDAGSAIPLDTLQRWRREILAGVRVGPPRQLLSGQSIGGPVPDCNRSQERDFQTCVVDEADARHYVDSLKAAGADMAKPRAVSRELYFAVAAEARRQRLPFGGHLEGETAIEASDSGAGIVDHSFSLGEPCASATGSVERCAKIAAAFRRNGTWWVPTCIGFVVCGGPGAHAVGDRYDALMKSFSDFSLLNPYTPDRSGRNVFDAALSESSHAATDPGAYMRLKQEAGIPFLAGTDVIGQWPQPFADQISGFALHAELAMDVAEGLAPLAVLQSATLNPAKFLRATDSLGTVATGKLADLVLLDADPLANIANTTMIRAVVANGRYFDRAALDGILSEVQAKAK